MAKSTVESWIDNVGQCLTVYDSNGNLVDPAIHVWSSNAEEQLQAWVIEESKRIQRETHESK